MEMKSFSMKNFLQVIQNTKSKEFENIFFQKKRLPYFILGQDVFYLELMLIRGLNPNLKSQNKKPLMFEASLEHLLILLEYGGNPKIKWGEMSLVEYIIKKEKNREIATEKLNLLKTCGAKVRTSLTNKNPYWKGESTFNFDKDSLVHLFQTDPVYKYEKLENGDYGFVKYEGKFDKEAYNSFILNRKKFEIVKR
jgi:hypothetical protein